MAKPSAPRSSAAPAPAPGQLASAWAGGKIPRAVLVLGGESALREEALAGIRKAAFGEGDGGMSWIVKHASATDSEQNPLTPAALLDEVRTRPLFGDPGESKVVVLRNAELLLNRRAGGNESLARDIFADYLEEIPEGSSLVFEVGQPGTFKVTRLYKALDAAGAVVNCEPLRNKWGEKSLPGSPLFVEVEKRARALGLDLNPRAVSELLDRSGEHLGVLSEELTKLALALNAAPGKKIPVSEQQVHELCANTRMAGAFEFADFVCERNLKGALETLGTIFSHGMSDSKKPGKVVINENEIAMALLGALTYRLLQTQDLRAVLDEGISQDQAFQAARLFGERQNSARKTLQKHNAASLRKAIEALFQANLDLRSSLGKQEALEKLAWSLARA